MSFETWYDKYPDTTEYVTGMHDAYNAGRAESEARIAALQSERDALREALHPFEYMNWAELERIRQHWGGSVTIEMKSCGHGTIVGHVTVDNLQQVYTLLIPASEEPARKP